MKKIIAYTKGSCLYGDSHKLECSVCGEDDRNKLEVEDIGIAVGMGGEEYSFCGKCWHSNDLGKKILALLGYEKIKILDESLDLRKA